MISRFQINNINNKNSKLIYTTGRDTKALLDEEFSWLYFENKVNRPVKVTATKLQHSFYAVEHFPLEERIQLLNIYKKFKIKVKHMGAHRNTVPRNQGENTLLQSARSKKREPANYPC